MKQVVITRPGGVEVLKVENRPDSAPSRGAVAIRVKASGINFADILARKGMYPDAPKMPCVVGYEVAGIVEAIGDDVDRSWTGRPVFALTRFNGYADLVTVPVTQIFDKPESLTFEQAAPIPVNYLTSYPSIVLLRSPRAANS